MARDFELVLGGVGYGDGGGPRCSLAGVSKCWEYKNPDWHWDLGGITYRFPGRSVDYVLEGTVGLAVEHAHSLGEFLSAPVANQFMGRLPRLSWYDTYTRGHRVINIP